MATILVVDDEAHIREVHPVRARRRRATPSSSPTTARRRWTRLQAGGIDLLVLDVLMPGLDGLTLCRRLRATADGGPPIVFLSSRGEELDRVLGLELGGDDYLPKPFGPRELVTRVNAVLAPRDQAPDGPHAGRAPRARPASARHRPARGQRGRRPRRADRHRVRHPAGAARGARARPDARAAHRAACARPTTHITERTVDTHVRRIRAKLRPHGVDPIETVHGLGYKAAAPPHERRGSLSRLPRWLFRIRTRLLLVNVIIVSVPVLGLGFARFYEREMLDAVETDMIHQARGAARALRDDIEAGPEALATRASLLSDDRRPDARPHPPRRCRRSGGRRLARRRTARGRRARAVARGPRLSGARRPSSHARGRRGPASRTRRRGPPRDPARARRPVRRDDARLALAPLPVGRGRGRARLPVLGAAAHASPTAPSRARST